MYITNHYILTVLQNSVTERKVKGTIYTWHQAVEALAKVASKENDKGVLATVADSGTDEKRLVICSC